MSHILSHLAAGDHVDKIIQEYPDLINEQIAACLDYARDLADLEVVA